MNLYDYIETLCAMRSISVTKMCKDAGVPRGSLGDLKSGRISSLSSLNSKKIAMYFGISVDDLMSCKMPKDEKKPSADSRELTDIQRRAIELIESIDDDSVLEIFIAAMEKAKKK